jgi:hypothetical protein
MGLAIGCSDTNLYLIIKVLFIRLIIHLFSACFFSRNSVFLSQQISQQCFSAGLSAQLNGAKEAKFQVFFSSMYFLVRLPITTSQWRVCSARTYIYISRANTS